MVEVFVNPNGVLCLTIKYGSHYMTLINVYPVYQEEKDRWIWKTE